MAGRKCTICDHPKRKEIDKACVQDGAVLRGIARQFAVSDDSLLRHVKSGHIIEKIKKAVKAQGIADADDLLQEVQEIQKITDQIIKTAITGMETKPYLALKAIDTRAKQIELKGKILGSFKSDKDNGMKAPVKVTVVRVNGSDDPKA